MREDIAGAQRVENLRHELDRLHSADVAHHLGTGAGLFTCRNRPLQRLQSVLGDDVLRHADLDADHHVGIFRDRLCGGVYLREVDVVELGDRERREPHIGDVHERVETGARLRHHVAAERSEIVGPGVACRHARRRALKRRELVGRNADRGAIRIDVRMQVDEARRHQLAGGVERAQRPARRNVGFERLDEAVADADVAPCPQRLAGVEHFTALDDEIELVLGPHGGARGMVEACGGRPERGRAGTDEKIAARNNGHGVPPAMARPRWSEPEGQHVGGQRVNQEPRLRRLPAGRALLGKRG